VEHYNSGGHFSPSLDPLIRFNVGLGLTEENIDDIIAFLKALSDQEFINNPDFSDPFRNPE